MNTFFIIYGVCAGLMMAIVSYYMRKEDWSLMASYGAGLLWPIVCIAILVFYIREKSEDYG